MRALITISLLLSQVVHANPWLDFARAQLVKAGVETVHSTTSERGVPIAVGISQGKVLYMEAVPPGERNVKILGYTLKSRHKILEVSFGRLKTPGAKSFAAKEIVIMGSKTFVVAQNANGTSIVRQIYFGQPDDLKKHGFTPRGRYLWPLAYGAMCTNFALQYCQTGLIIYLGLAPGAGAAIVEAIWKYAQEQLNMLAWPRSVLGNPDDPVFAEIIRDFETGEVFDILFRRDGQNVSLFEIEKQNCGNLL